METLCFFATACLLAGLIPASGNWRHVMAWKMSMLASSTIYGVIAASLAI